MTVTPLISIEAARAHLNLEASTSPADDGSDDAEIFDHIIAATEIVNSEKGYSAPTPFTEPVQVTGQADPNTGYPLLRVTRTPVLSVQSITDRFTGAVLDVSQLQIDAEAGVLTVPNGMGLIGPLTVAYTAGRADIPTTLQQACKHYVRWFWDTQRGGDAGLPPGVGEGESGAEGDGEPWRAKAIMDMSPETASPGFA